MVVQHNISAMNANRMLGLTTKSLSKSTEKLSSGYKVNRAADDAAGLSISEKMRKQIRGLEQATANAEDGISAVQTAEGALTEVHDMLQRMNELAVKAANGTMSLDDRQTVQDEVDQLLTEIDRVAETTKFNETYLLKGDTTTIQKYVGAKDAGLVGTMREGAQVATFSVNELKFGDTVSIGGKTYTIGGDDASKIQDSVLNQLGTAGTQVMVDGVQYTVAMSDGSDVDEDKNILKAETIKAKVVKGSSATVNGKTYYAMTDDTGANGTNDGVDDNNANVITADKAYKLMAKELKLANSIGVDGNGDKTKVTDKTTGDNATFTPDGGKVNFKIEKGTTDVKETLNFSLHVGADADMNNKIMVGIEAMDTAGLGIQGLNVKDSTGNAATYAIDSIADAVAKVSAQRSALGAIQNRLEHTINNLDNVVENTTSAESQIRDTDMATEMVKYSKNNILQQAGQSMLAQANQSNQGVLSLLG